MMEGDGVLGKDPPSSIEDDRTVKRLQVQNEDANMNIRFPFGTRRGRYFGYLSIR
ncbi:conserved hypothetical protein [Ricinus communis]|uniref:Uncharacterized protein n=1 Tax=Ricinus communis TaxID=3988 RepID=B9SG65_RICCO|nr:conserved hypothetical protein [Ricinus communis]